MDNNDADNIKNGIELIFVTVWTYGFGYLAAWFVPLNIDPLETATIFGIVGTILGFIGIEYRMVNDRYPVLLGVFVLGVPLTCGLMGLAAYVFNWLGLLDE